jgi:predicted small lipoprotein YifL
MRNAVASFVLLLLSLSFLSACGQTGPLFLPGNLSQIQTSPPAEPSTEETDDEDDQDPTIN